MDFCVGTCAKIDQVGLIKQAEDLGVTHFGVGEGPLLFSDPYQQMALASQQTSTISLGTMVSNPLTRIAPVTANSVATLNALAPGRTFLGIGTANNALRSMGHRPATIKELVDAVTVARGLLRGERVTHKWRGEETEIEFLDKTGTWYDIREVPIWMAAGGPKGLKAAAALADAVVYCLGPNPDMIKLVRRELDAAVEAAGREKGSVKLISNTWFYQLENGETWEDGIDKGFGSGPISSCITNAGFMNEHIDELGAPIVQASTQAAMAYLGDPTAPEPAALPGNLVQVPPRPGPLPPAADHQGTRRLLVHVRQPRGPPRTGRIDDRIRCRHDRCLPVQPVHRRTRRREHRQIHHRRVTTPLSTQKLHPTLHLKGELLWN